MQIKIWLHRDVWNWGNWENWALPRVRKPAEERSDFDQSWPLIFFSQPANPTSPDQTSWRLEMVCVRMIKPKPRDVISPSAYILVPRSTALYY